MIGIPVPVMQGEEEARIYLRTRRSGQEGIALARHKRELRGLQGRYSAIQAQVVALSQRAGQMDERAPDYAQQLQALWDELAPLRDQGAELNAQAQEHAEAIVRMALEPNYGAATQDVMEALSDAQIQALVRVLETGDVPADFFPCRVIPPRPSFTPPSGDAPSAPLPVPGTAQRT